MITAIVILIVIVSVAGLITYLLHRGDVDNDFSSQTPTTYTKEELDNIKLAEELYNKDLRPAVAKKAKPKVAKELEVIEPEFVEKIAKTAKVFPEDAVINLEGVKPVKKKRKYYPKKK